MRLSVNRSSQDYLLSSMLARSGIAPQTRDILESVITTMRYTAIYTFRKAQLICMISRPSPLESLCWPLYTVDMLLPLERDSIEDRIVGPTTWPVQPYKSYHSF